MRDSVLEKKMQANCLLLSYGHNTSPALHLPFRSWKSRMEQQEGLQAGRSKLSKGTSSSTVDMDSPCTGLLTRQRAPVEGSS
jgi:hypothetical protein